LQANITILQFSSRGQIIRSKGVRYQASSLDFFGWHEMHICFRSWRY